VCVRTCDKKIQAESARKGFGREKERGLRGAVELLFLCLGG